MSLKQCRDCKKPVSDSARVCPYCGGAYPANGRLIAILTAMIPLVIMGVIACSLFFMTIQFYFFRIIEFFN